MPLRKDGNGPQNSDLFDLQDHFLQDAKKFWAITLEMAMKWRYGAMWAACFTFPKTSQLPMLF